MPSQRSLSFAALLVAASLSVTAPAQERLEPVVVTPDRIARTADETLVPVSVISRREIETSNAVTVEDLLQLQPGVDVTRTGGPGGQVSVFLRGANSDQVLVLIDGVRVGSATSGLFAWTSLDPAQIERIEIVRGPRATLYGSDAIGGVIQIFTRRPQGLVVTGETGSFATHRASVGYGGGERVSYRVNAAVERSEGFDATRPGGFAHDPDADGMRENSISAGLEAPLTDRLRLESSAWYAEGSNEFDIGEIDQRNGLGRLGLAWDPTPGWGQRLDVGYSQDRQETDSGFPTAIDTRRNSVEWLHDILLGARHQLIAGLSYRRASASYRDLAMDRTLYDESVSNTGAFSTLRLDFGTHELELGLRHDHHGEFGGHTTGQASWGYAVTPALRLTAGYGTAFKAPSLNELFFPGSPCFFDPAIRCFAGDPDLEPERSRSAELGVRYRLGPENQVAVHVFHTEIDDLIANQGTEPGFAFRSINVDEARIRGIEAEWTATAEPWFWRGSLTVQQARDGDDNRLLRRAEEKAALVLGRRIGRVTLRTDAVVVNHREDFGDDDVGGYGLLNASMVVPVTRELAFTVRIDNLTDKDYELASGFNTAGRSYYIGVRYRPGADG